MGRRVRVEQDNTSLPDGRLHHEDDEVTLTGAEFAKIPQSVFDEGALTDLGYIADEDDEVVASGVVVAPIADPGTATAEAVADKVNELIAALTGAGKALKEA